MSSCLRGSGRASATASFEVCGGEILGFAGSEGNGQREALRSLGGFEEASGEVTCAGRPMAAFTPGAALEAGILSLSADRSAESIFPTLSVRENMTVQVLVSIFRCALVGVTAGFVFEETDNLEISWF